jgi:hypothetical protein
MAIRFSKLRTITKKISRKAERSAAKEAMRSGIPFQTQEETVSKYMVGGTKIKKGQTHIVEIAVYEKVGTKGILISEKKLEGPVLQTVFDSVITAISEELTSKSISDVVLPTLSELR